LLNCNGIGIENFSGNNSDISVYPNPGNNVLNILVSDENANLGVQIINNLGVIVKKLVLTKGKNEIEISELESGIYFLRGDNNLLKQKLVVQH
jgi:Secretion system C-terminal sorting domain